MTKGEIRNSRLQELCRDYLRKLRPLARKFGLEGFVDDTIAMNSQKRCEGTEREVQMLARMCNDERIQRTDVPKVLGKSYRQSFEEDDFGKVKRLSHQGIYSKISALLLASEQKAK